MSYLKEYTFERPKNFDLEQIFDCGQCFRFDKASDDDKYSGVAFGKYVSFRQTEKEITIFGADKTEFEEIWRHFLALDEDYEAIKNDIIEHFQDDKTIISAMEKGKGIRILHQEPWETVCSFIISQNNNIPRIKKIIEAMSKELGEKITVQDKDYYSFPTPDAIMSAGVERIFALRTGFRAAYIYDAAQKVASGEVDLNNLSKHTANEVMEQLMRIKGIGPKVASCAALFGFGKTEAFPVDVWMKKVISAYYPDGLDASSLGKYAGIAQQYLFYYERYREK